VATSSHKPCHVERRIRIRIRSRNTLRYAAVLLLFLASRSCEPMLTLICLGLASARFTSCKVKTPFLWSAETFSVSIDCGNEKLRTFRTGALIGYIP
jgi:hypothetical protein